MKVLFYSSAKKEVVERVQGVIEAELHGEEIEVQRTMKGLLSRLRKPRTDLEVTILLASRREELLDLILIRDLFQDMRIILILPDNHGDTISMGHKLFPRFIAYVDSDYSDVAAVLNKMIENAYNKKDLVMKGGETEWMLPP